MCLLLHYRTVILIYVFLASILYEIVKTSKNKTSYTETGSYDSC